jgi:NitT/TauT family transport system permease protein
MTLAPARKNAGPAAQRRSSKKRTEASGLSIRMGQLALAIAVLGSWELLARAGIIDEFFFPLPSDILVTVWEWVSTGYVFPHLWVTMQEAILAFFTGAAAGLFLGFLLARVRVLERLLDPFLKIFNALPRVVLAPIFLLWFGLGIWSKVAFGFTLVFFIVFFNTLEGVKSVDRVLVDNAKMLGASEKQLLRHVFIPSALTWIFSSLHISVGFAITGAVVGEYLGASAGVGYAIAQAQGVFDTRGVFAGMFILMIVVLVIDILVNRVERHLLRWRPNQSG